MLNLLQEAERSLPALLADETTEWNSLYINYHPPTVERLWMRWHDNFRLSLHRIHPCDKTLALFHPHPWPSAMKIVKGSYVMAVGYGSGNTPPPVAALIVASENSSYEMTHPDAWHYVAPIHKSAYTVMLTGEPWERESPSSDKPLIELSEEAKKEMITVFREVYPY